MRLFINNNEIDLYEKEAIGYTKQVNSLTDLSSRQTNFSKTFKVPKTAKNLLTFEGLGMTVTSSLVPYRKNTTRLFVGNICVIYKGWALFTEEAEDYLEINIYDGNIDFFKELDNVEFGDIDLPEITHVKEVSVIKANWELGNEFFKYLLADYNGKTHFIGSDGTTSYINADYLIPSVSVKYLWQRIFETFGFTYSGTIFQEEEFQNLYLTYPKGETAGEKGGLSFRLSFPDQKIAYSSSYNMVLFSPTLWEIVTELLQGEIISNTSREAVKHWQCPVSGFYNITITGSLTNISTTTSFFYLGKNLHEVHVYDMTSNENAIGKVEAEDGNAIASALNSTSVIEFDRTIYLNKGDTLTPYYYRRSSYGDNSSLSFELNVHQVDQTQFDQIGFFKGLTPKDLYREVMWRFGLTPFPSKVENHIEFLTYEERMKGPVLDWSDKFIQQVSRKYVYDGYAKQNHFRFKYNGEGDDFNDGFISIENENLKDKTDVIQSKTYSIERGLFPFLLGATSENVRKVELWEKEPTEADGEVSIEYNPRTSRFVFLREKELISAANIGSELLQIEDVSSKVRIAEDYNYSWSNIILKQYTPINGLFRNTVIIEAEFHLSELEFDAYELKERIYVKQLRLFPCKQDREV